MFPLIAIPIVIYSLLAPFGTPMTTPIVWVMSFEDLLVAAALAMLAVEIWRSTAPTPQTAKHLVASLILLLACIFEWFAPWSPSGTFLLLTLAAFVNLVVSAYVAFVVKGQNVWISNR